MPKISLNHSDAVELAALLTVLADWMSSAHKHTLADSLTTLVGSTAYSLDELRADLHRFVFLHGLSDGEELLGDTTS
jgi:hypothetical protein